MSIKNVKWSLENEAEYLDSAIQRQRQRMKMRRATAKFVREKSIQFEEFHGDEPTGNRFQSTWKEVKLMQSKADSDFLKAFGKTKPGKEKPRLVTYRKAKDEPAISKKLWEQ
jgi:hypothetical protein